jgi:hypothetical protein
VKEKERNGRVKKRLLRIIERNIAANNHQNCESEEDKDEEEKKSGRAMIEAAMHEVNEEEEHVARVVEQPIHLETGAALKNATN